MKTYNNLIHEYNKLFDEKNISRHVLKSYIFELCNDFNIDMYLNIDNEVDLKLLQVFEKGVLKILEGEPINYVLGYSYFYGYKLKVNSNVLIPRYETEELIGLVLSKYDEFFKNQKQVTIADIATGSGAIAIALKSEEPKLKMYASDISDLALNVAKENATLNNCDIKFFKGDMLEPLINNNIKLDILVSNPPYIPKDEKMEESVVEYEPHIALFGGIDGLYFYNKILKDARKILNDKFMIFFEIGYNQKNDLIKLTNLYFPKCKVECYKDINKKDRMLFITNI